MKTIILGAAGFIGTNLAIELLKRKDSEIILVDRKLAYFAKTFNSDYPEAILMESPLDITMDFDIIKGCDVVYHLVSSNMPTTSNQCVSQDLELNVLFSAKLFESCVKNGVKKVVFISSGGTVYGKISELPLKEDAQTYPITSYGLQKLTIEKLLYLYNYMFNLDYRIIRLSNPYGPYQRPNGILGAVTTFTYKALKDEEIIVYGDGSVVRDFIYIDDAIRGIINIADSDNKYKTYNLGSGKGTSICEVLTSIENALHKKLSIKYVEKRTVDVPANYLDISRYEKFFGKLNPIPLEEGIKKTADYMRKALL